MNLYPNGEMEKYERRHTVNTVRRPVTRDFLTGGSLKNETIIQGGERPSLEPATQKGRICGRGGHSVYLKECGVQGVKRSEKDRRIAFWSGKKQSSPIKAEGKEEERPKS